MELVAKQPTEIKSQFANVGRRMQQGQPLTKKVRDAICAHVLEREVQEALERIDSEAFGFFEITQKLGKTHMKFAGELLSEILLRDVSKEERANISASKFTKIADMYFLIPLLDHILVIYAMDRGLLTR